MTQNISKCIENMILKALESSIKLNSCSFSPSKLVPQKFSSKWKHLGKMQNVHVKLLRHYCFRDTSKMMTLKNFKSQFYRNFAGSVPLNLPNFPARLIFWSNSFLKEQLQLELVGCSSQNACKLPVHCAEGMSMRENVFERIY